MQVKVLGKIDYQEAYNLQMQYHQLRVDEEIDDTLLIMEHFPGIFTVGRKNRESKLPEFIGSIPVIKADRGGSITYHGPGQIMGYLIASTKKSPFNGPKEIFHSLSQGLISTLKDFDMDSVLLEDPRGLWTLPSPSFKIASFGVGIRKDVSFHGFCLNYDVDLSIFDLISPCDLSAKVMSNMKSCFQKSGLELPSLDSVYDRLVYHFS